ncbi:hypothetical protein INT45_001498 [Circinella minor]|uniref:Pentacotripeptide-repeat region of PRORP domain-containing protein n=1 Tax=Circinella minor TaxID=1195481 RepID=A0A8H7S9J1_9FUNG|nr:hypothetical protein INT45_001498 [Circinella minor]
MSTLKNHSILIRSIPTLRSTFNVSKQRSISTTLPLLWQSKPKQPQQQQQQQQQNNNHNDQKYPSKQPRQHLMKIDIPAAKAHKHLFTIPTDPHVAAQRVARIAKVTSPDDALEYLKCLRVGLQSTAAWNTIIQQFGNQGKASQAEKCFVQMRKRNIPPNEQTFTVLISAWAHSSSPSAIRHAEENIDRMARYDIKPSIFHYNTLLLTYEKTNTPIQNVFMNLPCQPNEYTYSIAFRCADNVDFVKKLWEQVQQKISTVKNNKNDKNNNKKASSLAEKARQITMTEEALTTTSKINEDNSEFTLDDRLVASFLQALGKTARDSDDIQLGIDTIEQLYGLHPSSSLPTTTPTSKTTITRQSKHHMLTPSVYSLDAILRFCGRSRRYKLGRDYYNLALKQYPELVPDKPLLDTRAWLDGANNNNNHTKKRHLKSK